MMRQRNGRKGWGALSGGLVLGLALLGGGSLSHAAASEPQTPADSVSDAIGALNGSFRVSEQGAATYAVPIVTPPGTAGVAPQIALGYSSSGGNGLVGQGWSLSGLSAVTRCRQTLYQDGVARPIDWTHQDRFCLDGQRLVLAPGELKAYGEAGATYRTEIDSYAKIKGVGGTLGKPDYFTVEGKDGVLRTYGAQGAANTFDSEQAARDSAGAEINGKVLTWAISRLTDSVGNAITFTYTDDASGQRIAEIGYAYGAGSTPGARIAFQYEGRDDDIKGYVAGYQFKTEKRLKYIDVYGRDSADVEPTGGVRRYSLTYDTTSTSAPLSRLTSLQECSSTTAPVCYPPTLFTWTPLTSGFASTPAVDTGSAFETEAPVISKPADVNGDGKMDLVWVQVDVGSQLQPTLQWAKSNGTTLVPQTSPPSMIVNLPSKTEKYPYAFMFHVLDYNNDGYADVLRPNKDTNTWVVHLAVDSADTDTLPDTLTNTFINLNIPLTNADTAILADLNADGLADLLYEKSYGQYGARLMQWVPDQGVNGFGSEIVLGFGAMPYSGGNPYPMVASEALIGWKSVRVVDFNGDGMADLAGIVERTIETAPDVTHTERHLVVYEQTAVGQFTVRTSHTLGVTVDPKQVFFVPTDVNGDGLTDYLFAANETASWKVYVNKGDNFIETQDLGDLPGDSLVQFIDYNRDGFGDLLQPPILESTFLRVRLYNPKTELYQNPIDTPIGYVKESEEIYQFMDVTGDGHPESVRITTVNPWQNNDADGDLQIRHLATSGATTAVNTIWKITNGLGAVTELTYRSLNQPAVHDFKLNSANGPWSLLWTTQSLGKDRPVLHAQPPTFVVSNAKSSAPKAGATAGLANVDTTALSEVNYLYTGAKIQGSGRGFLGFYKITSIDAQSGLWTSTVYRQDFPFIGRAQTTEVSKPDTPSVGQFRLLSSSNDWWDFQDWDAQGLTHATAPFPLFRRQSSEATFDLGTANRLSLRYTVIQKADGSVGQDAWGNVLEMRVTHCGNPTDVWCLTPVSNVITVNTYDTGSYGAGYTNYGIEKGRLVQSVVTHQRPGAANIVRKTTFSYDTGTPNAYARGLLKTETVDPDTALHTRTTTHSYDQFGNRTKSSVVGNVDGSTNQTRYTRWAYDARGRFATSTYAWTGNSALLAPRVDSLSPGDVPVAGEILTARLLAWNALGQPTQSIDGESVSLAGTPPTPSAGDAVKTLVRYGALGREYQRYNTTGTYATTFYKTGTVTQCPATLTAFYVETVAAGGATTRTCHDKLGRLVRTATKPFSGTNWIYADTTFDSAGRTRHQSQPYYNTATAYWSVMSYDTLGRAIQLIDPKGGVTQTGYTDLVTTVTNPLGQQREETRNYLGEVIKVRDHQAIVGSGPTGGATIDTTYDATGNLVKTELKTTGTNLALGVPTTPITTIIVYDAWGRKTSLNDPDKGTWTYVYNAFDELIQQTDQKGQHSDLGYDLLGRLISRTDYRVNGTIEGTTDWSYDIYDITVPGRLIAVDHQVKNAAGTDWDATELRLFEFDAFKRAIGTELVLQDRINGGGEYSDTVEYDQYGRVLKRLDASGLGRGAQYTYNANGYRSVITEAATGGPVYSTVLAMDAYGNITQERLGPNTGTPKVTTRTFEPERGLALTIRTADQSTGANDVQDLTYTWDAVGNLLSRQDQGGPTRNASESFTYDNLNRLKTNGVSTDTTSYDAYGNIKFKTGVGNYSYTDTAHAHAVTDTSASNRKYQYDANGNMIGDTVTLNNTVERTLAYATFDKPLSIIKNTTKAEFTYGADRNVFKRVDTVGTASSTTWYGGGIEMVNKSDGSYDLRRYIDGVAEVILRTDTLGAQTTVSRYLLRDHLGSVVGFVNGTTLSEEQAFDPWGCREPAGWGACTTLASIIGDPGGVPSAGLTRQGFTGHQHVDELNIIHMNGRTYETRIGRFMQADIAVQAPSDTQSYNRYSYVRNNPLNATDPSGYFFAGLLGPDPGSVIVTAQATAIAYQVFKQVPYEVGQAANAIGSLWCNAWYAACYGAGTAVNAYAHEASLSDSIRGGVVAGVSSWVFSPAGGPSPTDVGFQIAGQVLATENPALGQALMFVSGNWDKGVGDIAINAVGTAMQYGASRALEDWARQQGMTLQELNVLLALNSKFGKWYAGTTYDEVNHGIEGFFSRVDKPIVGVIWDVNDTLLNVQGLLDAVSMEVVNSPYRGRVRGHSLGAWRVNNLYKQGYVSGGELLSLPFLTYPAAGLSGVCGNVDFICGMALFTHLRPNTEPLSSPSYWNLYKNHIISESYSSQWYKP